MPSFLTISGSLRAASSNTAALEALPLLTTPGISIVPYRRLAGLPAFNPDLDGELLPKAVRELRTLVGGADGLIISSPEYARGIAGALKNLLDWLVGGSESRQADRPFEHLATRRACPCSAPPGADHHVRQSDRARLRDPAVARQELVSL